MRAAASLAVGLILSSAAPARQTDGVRALAVQYADGRRTVTALSSTGRVSWTPAFPRIVGADTNRDGLPLFAMQYEEAREDSGVAVTVALLYGRPHEKRVPVATVHVTGDEPVRVDALEAFGVRPVQLSLTSLPAAQLLLPSITTPSSYLETLVETATSPAPAYYVTFVNHSPRDVMMLRFMGYQGSRPGVSGRPRGSGKTALIPAGGTYVLRVSASSLAGRGAAPASWAPLDRIDITSVLWSDDVVEGDATTAADEHALDAGTALQLDRLVPLLRAAAADPAAHPVSELREAVSSLTLVVTADEARAAADAIPGVVRLPVETVRSTMADGRRNARSAVLNDCDELLKAAASPAPAEYAAWLARMIEKYAGWRSRIRP